MPPTSALSLDHIAEAATTIDPVFLNSPQFLAEGLSQQLGLRLVCKVEVINPIRSFKGRGTDYFAHSLGANRTPLVCASAGNFGQGLAYAARKRAIPLHVFAAASANPLKVAKMRGFGATVHLQGADFDAAKDVAREFAARQGWRFVEDGAEPAVAEGAGTMAVELTRWPEPFDALYVPVGNGALINGIGRWLKHVAPQTRLVGVGATGSPAMERSWRTGTVVLTDTADTIADGIATRVPVPLALREMALTVDDMILVDDAAIRDAMKLLYDELGLVLEPSGAAGLAAISAHRAQLQGQLVATILCGGNALPEHLKWEVGR
jgi:threonine dehydratase